MPQPTPFTRAFSFTDFAASNPTSPLPGYRVDADLDGVELTLAELLTNLAIIQRDDGDLANEIVTVDSLSPEVLALLTGGTLVELTFAIANVIGLQAALDLLAPLVHTHDDRYFTEAETTSAIAAAIAALVGTAPGVLDTLGEISDAINDDANLYTTLAAAIAGKQAASANLTTFAGIAPSANVQSLLAAANYAAIRTLLALGTAALLDEATAAEYRANTADKVLTTDQVWSAATPVALNDSGGNIAVDLSTGINFTMSMDGDYTLSNPTNAKPGQCGCIELTQDGTGTQTLAYGANWTFAYGADPVLSTAANAKDLLFYQVLADSTVFANLVKARG